MCGAEQKQQLSNGGFALAVVEGERGDETRGRVAFDEIETGVVMLVDEKMKMCDQQFDQLRSGMACEKLERVVEVIVPDFGDKGFKVLEVTLGKLPGKFRHPKLPRFRKQRWKGAGVWVCGSGEQHQHCLLRGQRGVGMGLGQRGLLLGSERSPLQQVFGQFPQQF